jgi:hypothetical protein
VYVQADILGAPDHDQFLDDLRSMGVDDPEQFDLRSHGSVFPKPQIMRE